MGRKLLIVWIVFVCFAGWKGCAADGGEDGEGSRGGDDGYGSGFNQQTQNQGFYPVIPVLSTNLPPSQPLTTPPTPSTTPPTTPSIYVQTPPVYLLPPPVVVPPPPPAPMYNIPPQPAAPLDEPKPPVYLPPPPPSPPVFFPPPQSPIYDQTPSSPSEYSRTTSGLMNPVPLEPPSTQTAAPSPLPPSPSVPVSPPPSPSPSPPPAKPSSSPSPRTPRPPAPPSPQPRPPPAQPPLPEIVDFKEVLKRECTSKSGSDTCEAVVTAQELQSHIMSANIGGVAGVLVHSTSVAGLAAGLRVPQGYILKENVTNREADLDVVAVNGLALAMLSVKKKHQNSTVEKLTQAIAIAVSPTANVTSTCERKIEPQYKSNSVIVEGRDSCKANEPPVKGKVETAKLRRLLLKKKLMKQILESDADKSSTGQRLGKGRRSPKCVGCLNSHSYLCAYCYPFEFCAHFHWCKVSLRRSHDKSDQMN